MALLAYKNLNILVGMTKVQIKNLYGLSYNDINTNVWMYYLNEDFKFTKSNFLYIIFKNDEVIHYHLRCFKTKKYYKIYK